MADTLQMTEVMDTDPVNVTLTIFSSTLTPPGYVYISPALLDLLVLIFRCIFNNILLLIGIAGNILNILVLQRFKTMSISSNILLISLAISDLSYCMVALIGNLPCLLSPFDPLLSMSFRSVVSVSINIWIIGLTYCSNTLVMVMSLERLVAVFLPFHISRIFTRRRIQLVVLFIYLITLIPMFSLSMLSFYFGTLTHPVSNRTFVSVFKTKFYIENEVDVNFFSIVVLHNIFFSGNIFIITLSCTAICIKLAINKRSMAGKKTSASSRARDKVGKMLLLVCVCYSVLSLPIFARQMYDLIVPSDLLRNPFSNLLYYITYVFYAVQASFNFFLYALTSKKFAEIYKTLLFCRIPKP